MCTAMEIFKKETFEKGEGIGFEKGQRELIINMYNNGMSIEDIAKSTNLSEEKVLEYVQV